MMHRSQVMAIHLLLPGSVEPTMSLQTRSSAWKVILRGDTASGAVDQWVSVLHDSVYQRAAHSMAAVGMLAPLVESMFDEAFHTTRSAHQVVPLG